MKRYVYLYLIFFYILHIQYKTHLEDIFDADAGVFTQ